MVCKMKNESVSCSGVSNSLRPPWTVAHQAPLPMGFSRQEHWSGLPCSSPEDLPDPGTEPASVTSPALAGGFFTTSATSGSPIILWGTYNFVDFSSHFLRINSQA